MGKIWTGFGILALALVMTPRFFPAQQQTTVEAAMAPAHAIDRIIKVRKPQARPLKLVQVCRPGGHTKCRRSAL